MHKITFTKCLVIISLRKIGFGIVVEMLALLCTFSCYNYLNIYFSYDITSGSNMMPCIKIDKPLVVYRFNDANNNVSRIIQQNLGVFDYK